MSPGIEDNHDKPPGRTAYLQLISLRDT